MKSVKLAEYQAAPSNEPSEGAGNPGGFGQGSHKTVPGACSDSDSALHKRHICYLKAQGQKLRVKRISNHPTVECAHCGAKANSAENVCAAHVGEDAPNVEGGHGSVGLDQIGKPHADW